MKELLTGAIALSFVTFLISFIANMSKKNKPAAAHLVELIIQKLDGNRVKNALVIVYKNDELISTGLADIDGVFETKLENGTYDITIMNENNSRVYGCKILVNCRTTINIRTDIG